MSLYAIGDFHLSFNSDKSMDKFGPVWVNHEDKIIRNFRMLIRDNDTVVITGDHSWGKNLKDASLDLEFIEKLPGRKILLRGNHDMFWEANKTERLNKMFEGRLFFMQDNFYSYEDYALVGTKGYCYEGRDEPMEHYEKLMKREALRLRKGFDKAKAAGFSKFIMFLHYPPTSIGEKESLFTKMAKEYRAEIVVYSHCHGMERYNDSYKGLVDGINYYLVSGDFLDFCPKRIL